MSRLARQLGRVIRNSYGLLESEMSVMPWVLPFLARRLRLASRAPRHCRLEGYPLLRYAQLHTAVGAYSYTLSRLCCISFTGWDMLQDNLQATTACHSAIQTDWFGTVLRAPPQYLVSEILVPVLEFEYAVRYVSRPIATRHQVRPECL